LGEKLGNLFWDEVSNKSKKEKDINFLHFIWEKTEIGARVQTALEKGGCEQSTKEW
jgi:hypothetical protein